MLSPTKVAQLRRLMSCVGRLLCAHPAAVLSFASVAAVFAPVQTHAQQRISVNRSIGGPGGSALSVMVTKMASERYARLLGFSAEQLDQVATIQGLHAAAFRERQDATRTAMQELQKLSEDSGDSDVFMEKVSGIQGEYSKATKKLETEFFADIKAMASVDQLDRWTKVERTRRREVGLRPGGVSGESVDLVAICERLKLRGASASEVIAALDQYELKLDRLLVANESDGDNAGFEPGKPIDVEKLSKAISQGKEAGMKIQDLNRDSAWKIDALLPESDRAAFAEEVKRASFPSVYRFSSAFKRGTAAQALTDLTPQQREKIDQAVAEYKRSVGTINAAWAKAIEAAEASGHTGAMSVAGGERVVMSMGEDSPELKDARKARRELDERLQKGVNSVLSAEQAEKLPEIGENEAGGEGRGSAVRPGERQIMIRRSE